MGIQGATAMSPTSTHEATLQDRVHALQSALDAGDNDGVEVALDQIARIREGSLFNEMGRITRQLHEALVGLQLDPQITSLTEHDIPDAKVRMDYVLEKTEEAAHRTLTAVEAALPLTSDLASRADELGGRWLRFQRRDMNPEEFRLLARELDAFLATVGQDTRLVGERLSEVLMAQDFQDLTGQVIRRVMQLVHEVQGHLVELMRTRGTAAHLVATGSTQRGEGTHAEGPQVIAAPAANIVQSQDDVDDLLSSLGF